jgi:hypothetical protein
VTTQIQTYLRNGNTLGMLESSFSIKAKRHKRHENLVLLKYDQISSPMDFPIVQECRGLILDEADNWACVSRSFDKFFNHGEPNAATIDWSTARVQEKVDGSLCSLYWYAGEWHVATTGTPDASGDVNGFGRTFSELFWEVWADIKPGLRNAGTTYMFEYTSPFNRIVVQHGEPSLTLLAARRADGTWLHVDDAADELPAGTWKIVQSHPLQSFDEIAATFERLNPLETEGYVVVDGQHRRVKVKHPGYVALHHAKDGLSLRAFVDIARRGETSEVISAFPEFGAEVERIRRSLDAMVTEIETDYARLAGIPEQKAFALEAVKTKCSAALFNVRAKKSASVREYLANVPVDNVIKLLGLKEIAQ